jgi:hypothetical protein
VAKVSAADAVASADDDGTGAELARLVANIDLLWGGHTARTAAARDQLDRRIREVTEPRRPSPRRTPKTKSSSKQMVVSRAAERAREAQAERARDYRRKRIEVAELRETYRRVRESDSVRDLVEMDAAELAAHLPGRTAREIEAVQKETARLMEKHSIPPGRVEDAFSVAARHADKVAKTSWAKTAAACFVEHPEMSFASEVRCRARSATSKTFWPARFASGR